MFQIIRREAQGNRERGSALVLSIFILVLLTTMGIGLLALTGNEARLSQANVRTKQAFFLAEAGQEDARTGLFAVNGGGSFDDDIVARAGADGVIDFDPTTLRVTYDGSGNATGLTGFGDDLPYRGLTAYGNGWYAAFLTNDPADPDPLDDTDDRVMLTAVGATRERTVEVVQAIIRLDPVVTPVPPAAITILGPTPSFDGGSSSTKLYSGDDCTDASVSVPVVGVIGSSAETQAEGGVSQPTTYVSGGLTGLGTVEDIDLALDEEWKVCENWLQTALDVKAIADVVGDSSTPLSDLGTPGSPKVVYIEGDYDLSGSFSGAGMLWVTGELMFDGRADWYGTLMVVGTGEFLRNGGGDGGTQGATIVADVAGPDGVMWTSDDCAGPDGVAGNADDAFEPGSFLNNGGGTHSTQYCLDAFNTSNPQRPYKIAEFLQH